MNDEITHFIAGGLSSPDDVMMLIPLTGTDATRSPLTPGIRGPRCGPAAEPRPRVDWGRDSAESRRLAWMLLFDASGSKTVADDWYDSFAEEVVERLPEAGFVLARDEIMAWLDSWT